VVRAHEEAVTLKSGAELERLPDDRLAFFLRDPVGECICRQPPADVCDRLELPVVLLLEQGGAHLRPACIHVQHLLPPAPRECEDRWGRERLLEPFERLLLQWRGGWH